MNNIARIAAAAIAAAVITPATATAASAPAPKGVVRIALHTPCEYEDSLNCYWDARSAGNGQGHSFYSIRVGHKVCTVFWDRAYNRRHGHCDPLDSPRTKGVAVMGPILTPPNR